MNSISVYCNWDLLWFMYATYSCGKISEHELVKCKVYVISNKTFLWSHPSVYIDACGHVWQDKKTLF